MSPSEERQSSIAATGPEFICDHSESLTELCDTCLARRYQAALERIAGLDTIVWNSDGTIKQQSEAGRIAREAIA